MAAGGMALVAFVLVMAVGVHGDIPSADDIADILAGHNAARASVQPSAADMLEMTWDDELAQIASAYSDRCVWGHNSGRPSGVGENIAIGTRQTAAEGVQAWVDEVEDWTYDRLGSDCRPGAVCGHYTQIIWASSDKVGCGRTYCADMDGLSFGGYYLVCNYRPAGNYRNQYPYVSGASCSSCPNGVDYACSNNMCSLGAGDDDDDTTPPGDDDDDTTPPGDDDDDSTGSNCPNNCSGNGFCREFFGTCVCDDGYTGDDCSIVEAGDDDDDNSSGGDDDDDNANPNPDDDDDVASDNDDFPGLSSGSVAAPSLVLLASMAFAILA